VERSTIQTSDILSRALIPDFNCRRFPMFNSVAAFLSRHCDIIFSLPYRFTKYKLCGIAEMPPTRCDGDRTIRFY
jgi:hypothetical protein